MKVSNDSVNKIPVFHQDLFKKGRIFIFEGGYLSEGGKQIQRIFWSLIKPCKLTKIKHMLEKATIHYSVLSMTFTNTKEQMNE